MPLPASTPGIECEEFHRVDLAVLGVLDAIIDTHCLRKVLHLFLINLAILVGIKIEKD